MNTEYYVVFEREDFCECERIFNTLEAALAFADDMQNCGLSVQSLWDSNGIEYPYNADVYYLD